MLTTATIYNRRSMIIGKWKGKSLPGSRGRQDCEAERNSTPKIEKEIERKHGRLTLPDEGIHTVNMTEAEHRYWLFGSAP